MAHRLTWIGIGAVALLATGCVATRGGAVAPVPYDSIAVPRMERTVVYELKVASNTGGDFEVQKWVTTEIEAALRAAGADPKRSGEVATSDYTLVVDFDAHGSVAAQALSGFISGLTFMVVPGYAGIDLRLDAFVKDAAGSEHRYHYADRYAVWIEIFLLPFSNNPDKVAQQLIGDMARSLARDMQRDGLLPKPSAVAAAPPD